ncbi:MAG: aminopeptidase [Acidilobaceae archaeon]|nr:aminopeptidase [Acidilobaceae archaeon]
MIDVRKHAELLVRYCGEVRKGDEVQIRASLEAMPLVKEIYRSVVNLGAYPRLVVEDEELTEIFYRHAPRELLEYLSPIDKFLAENVTVSFAIISSTHVKPLVSIDPERVKVRSNALRPLTEIFMRRDGEGSLRWTVTLYPTRALAQEAGMSIIEYQEFVARALKLHLEDPVAAWQEQAKSQERIASFLSRVSELRVKDEDTDLLLRVDGRIWINDEGKRNMPGGEVFTGPHEDATEGHVTFTYPAVWRGYEVEGVRLRFSRGAVVEASAAKGEEFLKRMLEVDEGARRLGEAAFGLNYDIQRHTKQILFDEKIGGTMHLALGAAYPKTGGRNVSAIHWDMIKDMRRAKVFADGELVYENGKFLLEVL